MEEDRDLYGNLSEEEQKRALDRLRTAHKYYIYQIEDSIMQVLEESFQDREIINYLLAASDKEMFKDIIFEMIAMLSKTYYEANLKDNVISFNNDPMAFRALEYMSATFKRYINSIDPSHTESSTFPETVDL
jgi:hypothetical protein